MYLLIKKANALNDYFVSVSSIDDSNTSLPIFNLKTNESLCDIIINEEEVKEFFHA
jgi:hypothetical protein